MRNIPDRQFALADALFGKTKKAVIGILYSQPGVSIHLRELSRLAQVSAPMMSRELDTLVSSGIVISWKDGNRTEFQANKKCPIFKELYGISIKILDNRSHPLPANHREEKTRKQKEFLSHNAPDESVAAWKRFPTKIIDAPSF